MLLHSASEPGTTELSLSPIQMHSLRSFWTLLIPSPTLVWVLYLASSMVVIAVGRRHLEVVSALLLFAFPLCSLPLCWSILIFISTICSHWLRLCS